MNPNDFFTLYFATIGVIGAMAGFIINHLLKEISALHVRVNEIYQILLER